MALTVNSIPTKQKGTTLSNWLACHNPVVFKIGSDAIPNQRDVADDYVSVAEFRGNAVFTLSSTSTPGWYAPFLKVTFSGILYNQIGRITRFDPATLEVYTDIPYQGNDSGTALKYYDSYLIEILPTIGLPSGHTWQAFKPETVGTIQRIAPNNSVSVFDLQTQLQQNVNSQNDLKQLSFPNDLNAFTGFKIEYRESYIDLAGAFADSQAISGYGNLNEFAQLTVTSVSEFSSGGYAILSGFSNSEYNLAIVKIRQIVNSTNLQIEASYDAYRSLTGYETIQPFSVTLSRFVSDYISEGNQYWAVNAKQALGSFYGNNLVEYLADNPTTLAKFMTIFERRTVFADKYEDFTIIVDSNMLSAISGDNVLAYRQRELDRNGNVINTAIEVINSQDEGVYRLPTGGNPSLAVENLVASNAEAFARLDWDALENIPLFANYEIWRSLSPDVINTGELLDTSLTNSYIDTSIEQGVDYYYIVRAVGAYASKFSNEVTISITIFTFQTNWNADPATGGTPFNPLLSGGSVTWKFGPDEVTANSPNYSGTYLDGTTKTVTVISPDFTAIFGINFSADKIVGDLDLSIFTGGDKSINLFDNRELLSVRTGVCNLTSFTTASNGTQILSALYLAESTCTGVLNLSTLTNNLSILELPTGTATGLTLNRAKLVSFSSLGLLLSGSINMSENTLLTSATFDPNPQTISGINIRATRFPSFDGAQFTINGSFSASFSSLTNITIGAGNLTFIEAIQNPLNTIDLGNAVISSITTVIGFQDNGMTIAEVDAVWIELDRVAIVTGIARTINVGGGNAAPSGTSLTARNSLISKGYTLII